MTGLSGRSRVGRVIIDAELVAGRPLRTVGRAPFAHRHQYFNVTWLGTSLERFRQFSDELRPYLGGLRHYQVMGSNRCCTRMEAP